MLKVCLFPSSEDSPRANISMDFQFPVVTDPVCIRDLTNIFLLEVGIRCFVRSPLPLVRYLEIVLPLVRYLEIVLLLRAGPQLSKI